MLPYQPAPRGYPELQERAGRHRDQYEMESLERAREADRSGYSNPNMFSNEMRTMTQNAAARGQAAFAPQWDAYFEAASPDGENPIFGSVAPSRKRLSPSLRGLQPSDSYGHLSTDQLIEQGRAGTLSKGTR
jgi:hypothetical protein